MNNIHSSLKSTVLVGYDDREIRFFPCVGGDDIFHEINQVQPHNLLLLLSVA